MRVVHRGVAMDPNWEVSVFRLEWHPEGESAPTEEEAREALMHINAHLDEWWDRYEGFEAFATASLPLDMVEQVLREGDAERWAENEVGVYVQTYNGR